MSMSSPVRRPRSSWEAYESQVWREFFGDLIRSAREQRELSIEEAARAAGISAADWESFEAGTVPRTPEQLRALAAGLALELEAMVSVVLWCRPAWGSSRGPS
jgi:transcriptional regulator with XRE-family HTH domain